MSYVVAIAGSPAYPSRTHSLLEYATQQLEQQGIQSQIISVRDLPAEDLVFGRYDSANLNPAKHLIEQADGLIIATPVYKASYTGVLKAFLDLLPQKALAEKVVLPIATGGTIAHLLTIDYALKPVLSELGARHFINSIYALDKQIQRQEDGSIQFDEDLQGRLHNSLSELAVAVKHKQPVSQEFALAS
jgi:FMN reductase